MKILSMLNSVNTQTNSTTSSISADKAIKEYGTILHMQIDQKIRKISASVRLHGETNPLAIQIEDYEIVSQHGFAQLIIKKASCNRPWLGLFAEIRPEGMKSGSKVIIFLSKEEKQLVCA